jgi:hypothetical protein
MTPKAYRLLRDSGTAAAEPGTTVFECAGYDWGQACDDTCLTGIRHVSVTLRPDGGYPFFTVPECDLAALPEAAITDGAAPPGAFR